VVVAVRKGTDNAIELFFFHMQRLNWWAPTDWSTPLWYLIDGITRKWFNGAAGSGIPAKSPPKKMAALHQN